MKFFVYIYFFSLIVLNVSNLNADDFLNTVIKSENRTPKYVLRDKYRNPEKTLLFFGIKRNMKVVELQPSGGNSPGGWYTEILAPYLKDKGLLIAAHLILKSLNGELK